MLYKTLAKRFLWLIPQLFALSILVFILSTFMPGDALTGLINPDMSADDVYIMRASLGLNLPIHMQYTQWLQGILLSGDFGRSTTHMRPVTEIIGERAMNTLRLSIFTTFFIYFIAIPLGIIAAKYKNTIIDKIIIFYTYLALAMPTIVFALINIFIFGFNLRLFPTSGSVSVDAQNILINRLWHLILPGLTGAILSTVHIINLLRAEIIIQKNCGYVVLAMAKGVPYSQIYTNHILKNASLPIISGISFTTATLLTGSIFIERIFGYPGMGNLFITSILGRDFPVVIAIVLLYGTFTAIGTLLADIILMIIDPRVRID